ncbi:glycosyltransferase family 4 protein [uncultured Pseudoxanthomonas sp.]|uniref:glycosyltransferase family 4 protein n=1 Tax=uncultured Pseudoxanthomonas sp. TaxID=281701 RepID=UPI00262E062C|nr:glycosyltransferase family 4 protein [uncultured Pseudoxanthomonas sp.]
MTVELARSWLDLLRAGWLGALYRRILPLPVRESIQSQRLRRSRARYAFPRTPAWTRDVSIIDDTAMRVPASGAGVNVVGYLRAQFGLGESARNYARALRAAGVPVALVDIDLSLPHARDERSLDEYIGSSLPHPVTLLFVNPDYLQQALVKLGHPHKRCGYLIGCWFWELERLPLEWRDSLSQVDEVLVATAFIEAAVREASTKPILRVPLPLPAMRDSGLQRCDFGIDSDAFVFLFSFDFASWIDRKNPMAVIRAFRHAFPAGRNDVLLVIKSSNGYRLPHWFRELVFEAGNDPRVLLRDEVIDKVHVTALQRCADAYVSLHRAEGFGLGMAESMAMGKPVLATGWSGNLEFMDAECAGLIDYSLVPVPEAAYPGSAGQRWAEPDEEHAAHWMQRLADDRVFAKELGERGRDRVREVLSAETVAGQLRARLYEIHEKLAGTAQRIAVNDSAQGGMK